MSATLQRDLAARVDGEVRFDAGSRAAYAHDASNYRQPPIGVVVPRNVDAAVAAVEVCREHDVPVLSRGGGTSLAGQCCNEGVVIDWSKYCDRLVSVDPERRRAVVEPGACLDDLNGELAEHDLMVGPRPSTHDACTIGGMIGNNSCGASAQAYGKMADSVARLEVLTYDGVRTWVGPTPPEEYERILAGGGRRAEIYRRLHELVEANLARIRTGYPEIPRRVSGYNLDALLPENGFDLARALVGTESTLVTVLHAEITLFPVPPFQSLVVLGYDDVAAAGDAVPAVARHEPIALEGVDRTLIDMARAERVVGEEALRDIPEGSGWLMARFAGDTREQADERADRLLRDVHRSEHDPRVAYLDDPEAELRLWKVREAGLGATAYPPGGRDTHEGWEDAAVPPDRLGDYLRDFRSLLEEFGYGSCSLYGHFGQGCVHTRIPFDLDDPEGVETYRRFAERAARLVTSYGGSLSGEHGDGQSRAELLTVMFGEEIVGLFGRCKEIFDPRDRMNPGKVAAPAEFRAPSGSPGVLRLDENIGRRGYHPDEPRTHFHYSDDHGRFTHAAGRCVGIGKCRASSGGVMCPSYRVTHEERHTTRGRSRLLLEMMRGMQEGGEDAVVKDGWRSKDVHEALDLCLACKGCKSDCPVNVDMATYKAEFLSHHYRHRVRPRSHYSMGWLPVWARLAALAPGAVNALAHAPVLDRAVKAAGGIDRRRTLPRFARQRLTTWFRERDGERGEREERADAPAVVLWPDTFTDNFHPSAGQAAVRVLEAAGFRVEMPPPGLCCGLTWISTGQLGVAARALRRTARALAPRLRAGTPVIVLEPSCAGVFRADAAELLPDDPDVRLLAKRTHSLAELLLDRAPQAIAAPPPGTGREAIAQPHCHQHAVWGFDADREVLRLAGVRAEVLDVGCCGLAGNFGFERGHYEVSTGAAELGLWPRVRDAAPDTAVLADGFSCRTQIADGTGVRALHLAELLAEAQGLA
ncbi:FAD-binding and (Fe-S)-binding domain-containing protein [Actinomadura chibensis]|uniref:FAD-binding protein n=1 Tax=Actinomadura chibensis TaxID=392828 RepID=A0A5D0NDD3_9ACTN|nr:FAD-binding and (Fe-S)-binding domain-containing protein [Actinomadura chibensis]TYB42416.1 FAD-binding protein [Actinomadura chibensis]